MPSHASPSAVIEMMLPEVHQPLCCPPRHPDVRRRRAGLGRSSVPAGGSRLPGGRTHGGRVPGIQPGATPAGTLSFCWHCTPALPLLAQGCTPCAALVQPLASSNLHISLFCSPQCNQPNPTPPAPPRPLPLPCHPPRCGAPPASGGRRRAAGCPLARRRSSPASTSLGWLRATTREVGLSRAVLSCTGQLLEAG